MTKSSDWDGMLFSLYIEFKSYDFFRRQASQIDDLLSKKKLEFLAGQEQ